MGNVPTLCLRVLKASTIESNKKLTEDGKPTIYTKLVVDLGRDLETVIAEGDYSMLDGAEDVRFSLGKYKDFLRLRLEVD